MKWNLKPISLIKNVAAGISVVTLCISPVAQGAAAASQKELINQFLKGTGLTTKKMTVGEYWRMVRHVYPTALQVPMDQWVRLNREQLMPSVEATSFKGADGKEQVRLTLTKDGKSMNLTFTGDEEVPVKFNSVPLSKKELFSYNQANDLVRKIAQNDPMVAKELKTGKLGATSNQVTLRWNEYKKLTARQRAEYLVRMRMAMDAADKVFQTRYKNQSAHDADNKYEFVLQTLFGNTAFAGVLTGKPCIIAGFISKYGRGDSCGSEVKNGPLNADLSAQMKSRNASCGGGVACNPLVYGFQKGGVSFCVPGEKVQYATAYCNEKSPIATADDKKRIIESYMEHVSKQKVDLKLNPEGKITEDQKLEIDPFLGELNEMVLKARSECEMPPLKEIKKARQEQDSACTELQKRMIALETFAVAPVPPPPPLPDPQVSCKPGYVADTTGKCVCPAETKEENGQCVAVYVDDTAGTGLPGGKTPGAVTSSADSCGFWCSNKSWIIPGGIFLALIGILAYLFKNKSKAKDPVYVPPAPVDPGTPTPTPVPSAPPVDPPPQAPCPSPNTVVNGVCTPPVVVPPPTSTEGGSKPDTSGRASGVR